MNRKRNQKYSDFIQERFLKSSVILFVSMYLIFILFMIVNVGFAVVRETKKDNKDINLLLSSGFNQIFQESRHLVTDESILLALSGDTAAIQKAKTLLYRQSNKLLLDNCFVLMDSNKNIVATNLYKVNQDSFVENMDINALISKAEMDYSGKTLFSKEEIPLQFGQEGSGAFGVGIKDKLGEIEGFLLFILKEDSMYQSLRSYETAEVTVTDKFDNIVFSTQYPIPDPTEKLPQGRLDLENKGKYIAVRGNTRYYFYESSFLENEFYVYTLTPINYQLQMFFYGSIILLFVGALFTMLVLFVLAKATQKRLVEIDHLVDVANHIGRGDLEYRARNQDFSEFQALSEALNLLSEQLQQTIKDNQELAEHQRVMELKQLESQFNPHFMFNTLETLRYQIVMDPQNASMMVVKFANLMRYSLQYGSTLIPLKIDIRFLEDYLALQKLRFGQRLEYFIDIDKELLEKEFPKLLLQPIVENSMVHGTQKKQDITVTIKAVKENGKVVLSVKDTGDGISESNLKGIRKQLQMNHREGKHFGLYSVQRTIRLTYGENYGVEIDSVQGEGTMVRLTLPPE